MDYNELLKAFSTLTAYQQRTISMAIIDALELNEEDRNNRPKICPFCQKETRTIKKGFRCRKQRYQCKNCKHIFTYNSHTITQHSKIEPSMFRKIVLDTLSCIPIRQTAATLNLSSTCVFQNRHKILCALEVLLDEEQQKLCGTIEFDETFELESKKGERNITRKARKRGGSSDYRGLSREQMCIVTTTDRDGHEIFKCVGFGKPTASSIVECFKKNIVEHSIIYCDGATCYNELGKETNCNVVHLKSHQEYNIVEHINTVNYIHTLIKKQLCAFKGVSTKYINRYCSLFVFIRRFQNMADNELLPIILRKLKNLKFSITRNKLSTSRIFGK